jgi:hypothetical protein
MNDERLDDHQKFKELAALAQRGELTGNERRTLDRHLQICASCREVYAEYSLISSEGMPLLAAAHGYVDESQPWDDRAVRNKLLARVEGAERPGSSLTKPAVLHVSRVTSRRNIATSWATAIAACVLVSVAFGAYHLGSRVHKVAGQPAAAVSLQPGDLSAEKKTLDNLIALQAARMSRLQLQVSSSQQEITRLRDALHAAESRSTASTTAKAAKDEEFRQVVEQRDGLAARLRDAQQAYQSAQTELTSLRAEHDRVVLRTTSLESKIDELSASSHDQERRLKDDEQFLSSDRDIRELMGARKLYIADVFDVDSGSRTRKPFGRVFYTQSKSLIFYAFDLDHEPGVKNASAFQVWGQRDFESGEKNHATNLGILYMDSESNRRWVLRLEDPKQLAEIDAVFVTVEPHGGSQKPTGKPFLYALLRKEANHP